MTVAALPAATRSSGAAVAGRTTYEHSGRSLGSLSLNRALMAAGLAGRLQLTIFPVITGQTGAHPLFQDAAGFDLKLIESRTSGGHIHELIYHPTLH